MRSARPSALFAAQRRRRSAAALVGLGLAVLGGLGCSGGIRAAATVTGQQPVTLLAQRCLPINGSTPLILDLAAPAAGSVVVEVRERGIEVAPRLERQEFGALAVRSAVERSAWHVLFSPAAAGERLKLRISPQDSPQIAGLACVAANFFPNGSGGAVLELAQELSNAGVSTAARRWSGAFESYAAAARILDRERRAHDAAEIRLAMAELAYRRLGRDVDALALASAALAGTRGTSADPVLLARLLIVEAKALMELPAQDEAGAPVDRLVAEARLALRGVPGERRELARMDTLAGYWKFLRHERPAARRLFDQAARTCHQEFDAECEARARQNLAYFASSDGRLEDATAAYESSLALLNPEWEPELAADIYANLSQLRGELGLFSNAERLARTALQLYASVGNCDGSRRALYQIGALLAQVGDADAARNYLRFALLACRPLIERIERIERGIVAAPERPALARAPDVAGGECAPRNQPVLTEESRGLVRLATLALARLDLDVADVQAARACLAAAGKLLQSPGMPDLRVAIVAARVDLAAGDASTALARLGGAARAVARSGVPPSAELRGQLDLATASALLAAGRPREAWIDANRALSGSSGRNDTGQILAAIRVAARSLRAAGLGSQAIELLQATAELAERVPITALGPETGATFVASQHGVFSDLADLLATSATAADPATERREQISWQALGAVEAGRARTARAALLRTQRDQMGQGEPESAAQLVAVRDALATRFRALGELRQVDAASAARLIAVVRGALDAAGVASGPRAQEAAIGALPAFAARLAATGAVVEYAAAGDDLLAFVIEHPGLRMVRLGRRSEITALSARFAELQQDPDAPESLLSAAASGLAARIWWPLGLGAAQAVLIVPDDAVDAVPFSALPWSAQSRELLVLDRARTALAPSLLYAMARAAMAQPRAGGGFVVLGDPVFRTAEWRQQCSPDAPGGRASGDGDTRWTEQLATLPGSADEALGIARLTAGLRPGRTTTSLTRCQATASGLRRATAGPVSLLHLATHAHVDLQRPRLSALALTPEVDGDRIRSTLGYAEIASLGLRARLVTLGACDTSRGRTLPGEGVLGPAQAFLQGGANSVLGTLWPIDDARTAQFMRAFYRRLLAEGRTVEEALRLTQLDFRRDGGMAGSQFWAAFAVYGDPDTKI